MIPKAESLPGAAAKKPREAVSAELDDRRFACRRQTEALDELADLRRPLRHFRPL
jgi:hypothetical protein